MVKRKQSWLAFGLLMACSSPPDASLEQAGAQNSGGRAEQDYLAAGYLIQRPGHEAIDSDCTGQSSIPDCVREDGAANAPHCGATLVSPFFALTGAHCLDLEDDSPLDIGHVRYDRVLVQDAPPLGVGVGNFPARRIVPVHYVIVHPDYVRSGGKNQPALNDIALVKVHAPGGTVATLANEDADWSADNCNFRFVGYGYHPFQTQFTIGERRSHSACFLSSEQVQAFGDQYPPSAVRIAPGNIAFQGHDGNSCIADSGSAVFLDGTNILVGVLSALISVPDTSGNVPVCPAIASSLASIQSVPQHRHFIDTVIDTCTHKASVRACLNALGITRQLHKTPSPPWLGPPFPKPRW